MATQLFSQPLAAASLRFLRIIGHVSTGVAPQDYLDKMLAEPFAPFTFSTSGAAVYQLGPFGTAAKELQQLKISP